MRIIRILHIEVDVLDDVTVVAAVKAVIDGEKFIPLIIDGQVADPVPYGETIVLAELSGLNLIGVPFIGVHCPPIAYLEVETCLRILRMDNGRHREIAGRIDIIAGIYEPSREREMLPKFTELVNMVNMRKVLSWYGGYSWAFDESDIGVGTNRMIVSDDDYLIRLLEELAPPSDCKLQLIPLRAFSEVGDCHDNFVPIDLWVHISDDGYLAVMISDCIMPAGVFVDAVFNKNLRNVYHMGIVVKQSEPKLPVFIHGPSAVAISIVPVSPAEERCIRWCASIL